MKGIEGIVFFAFFLGERVGGLRGQGEMILRGKCRKGIRGTELLKLSDRKESVRNFMKGFERCRSWREEEQRRRRKRKEIEAQRMIPPTFRRS